MVLRKTLVYTFIRGNASYLIPPTDIEKCEKKKHSLSISVAAPSKTAGAMFQTWINWKIKDKYNAMCNSQKSQRTAVREVSKDHHQDSMLTANYTTVMRVLSALLSLSEAFKMYLQLL